MVEIQSHHQREYEAAMTRLRDLATADPEARSAMHAASDRLKGGCPHLVTTELVRERMGEAVSDFGDDKSRPFKPETYALYRHIGSKIWEIFEPALCDLVPRIVENLNKESYRDFDYAQRVYLAKSGVIGGMESVLRLVISRYLVGQEGGSYSERVQFAYNIAELSALVFCGNSESGSGVKESFDQDESDVSEGIHVLLIALLNAIGTISNDILRIPGVFYRQFGREITREEFNEILDSLLVLEMLKAGVQFQVFTAMRRNEEMLDYFHGYGASHLVGRTREGKLSMGYRLPVVETQHNEQPVVSTLGCALKNKIKPLCALLRELFIQFVPLGDNDEMEAYRSQIEQMFKEQLERLMQSL